MNKFRAYYKKLMWQVAKIDWFNEVVILADDYGYLTGDISLKQVVLMQYTGLHDKNGKEIYDGDIVKYWENIGYIEFYQGSWVINWNDGSLFDLYGSETHLEIIGNIHEHKYLLK